MAVLEIRVDASNSEVKLRNISNELDKTAKSSSRLESTNLKTSASLSVMATRVAGVAAAVYAASASVSAYIRTTDNMSLVNSRLKLVTSSMEELTKAQSDLFNLSQNSRQEYIATVDLFSRMARATKDLGTSQGDLLTVTESINKALIVSGASTQEAQSAITQLGQGLAAGVLRGEEFNSIMENGNRIAIAMADSLGVNLGQLRAMAAEGKLTAEVVINALKDQSGVIDKEFDQMTITVGQSWTVLSNSVSMAVSDMDKVLGTNEGLGKSIIDLSKLIDENKEDFILFAEFSVAAVSRTIDIFNVLFKTADYGVDAMILGTKIGFNSLVAEIMGLMVDFSLQLEKIGLSSRTITNSYLLSMNRALEKANIATAQLKDESNDLAAALIKANIPIEERVMLAIKEKEASKDIKDSIDDRTKSTIKLAEESKKLLTLTGNSYFSDMTKQYQSLINIVSSETDKINDKFLAFPKTMLDSLSSSQLDTFYSTWSDELEKATQNGLKEVELDGWQKTFTDSTSQALVDAIQSGDVSGALASMLSGMGASGLQNVTSTLAGGLFSSGGISGAASSITAGDWAMAGVGIISAIASSGKSNEEKLAELIEANNEASARVVNVLESQKAVLSNLVGEGTASGVDIQILSEQFRNELANIYLESRDQAADWKGDTHKVGFAAFDVYADMYTSHLEVIENLDTVFDATMDAYNGLKPNELADINAKFEVAANNYIAGISGLAIAAIGEMDSFKALYDKVTGTTKYSDIALAEAKSIIGFVDGTEAGAFLDEIIGDFGELDTALTNLENVTKNSASSTADIVIATKAVENAYGGSVEQALNYRDSFYLVMEAEAEAAEVNRQYALSLQDVHATIDNIGLTATEIAAKTLQGVSGFGGWSIEDIASSFASATGDELHAWVNNNPDLFKDSDVKSAIMTLISTNNEGFENTVSAVAALNTTLGNYDNNATAITSIRTAAEMLSLDRTTATQLLSALGISREDALALDSSYISQISTLASTASSIPQLAQIAMESSPYVGLENPQIIDMFKDLEYALSEFGYNAERGAGGVYVDGTLITSGNIDSYINASLSTLGIAGTDTIAELSDLNWLMQVLDRLGDSADGAADSLTEFDTSVLDSAISAFDSIISTTRGYADWAFANNASYSGGLYKSNMSEAERLNAIIASGDYTDANVSALNSAVSNASKYGQDYFGTQRYGQSYSDFNYQKTLSANRMLEIERTAIPERDYIKEQLDELKLLRADTATQSAALLNVQNNLLEVQKEIALLQANG